MWSSRILHLFWFGDEKNDLWEESFKSKHSEIKALNFIAFPAGIKKGLGSECCSRWSGLSHSLAVKYHGRWHQFGRSFWLPWWRGRGVVALGRRCVDVVVGVVCEIEALPCTVLFRQALAEMLSTNRTLTHLNLQSCTIGVKGIKAQRIDFVHFCLWWFWRGFLSPSQQKWTGVDVADDVWTQLSTFDV